MHLKGVLTSSVVKVVKAWDNKRLSIMSFVPSSSSSDDAGSIIHHLGPFCCPLLLLYCTVLGDFFGRPVGVVFSFSSLILAASSAFLSLVCHRTISSSGENSLFASTDYSLLLCH